MGMANIFQMLSTASCQFKITKQRNRSYIK